MRGANNHFFGRKHSEETKNKLREIAKQHIKTEKTVSLWIEKVAKKPASDKQKKAASIAAKNKVMLKNKHTGECVRVDRQQALMYDTDVWKNPAAISQARSTCIHCGITSVNGNIRRWHNENCKHNPSRQEKSI
jgi:phage tail tape-measure protein